MDNTNTGNHEILMKLVQQLSDINENIMKRTSGVLFNEGRWRYLFGFNAESASSKEDYLRYVIFIKSVTDTLSGLGIHRSSYGYNYIVEAVKIFTDVGSLDLRLINDVYPYIALQFGCNGTSVVEHNIRNAIKAAFRDHERDSSANKMGVFSRRPTNKEFLVYVTECVWRSMMNNEALHVRKMMDDAAAGTHGDTEKNS